MLGRPHGEETSREVTSPTVRIAPGVPTGPEVPRHPDQDGRGIEGELTSPGRCGALRPVIGGAGPQLLVLLAITDRGVRFPDREGAAAW